MIEDLNTKFVREVSKLANNEMFMGLCNLIIPKEELMGIIKQVDSDENKAYGELLILSLIDNFSKLDRKLKKKYIKILKDAIKEDKKYAYNSQNGQED